MKIKPMIWLLLVSLLSMAFRPSYQTQSKPPGIRLDADGVTAVEEAYSYCWPAAVGNNQCYFSSDLTFANPHNPIEISDEQSITVIIENSPVDPTSLKASLDPDGVAPQVFDLSPAQEAIIDAGLPVGQHILQVDASYANVEGVKAYISYRFAVKVFSLHPTPTLTPTAIPSPTHTPKPSSTPTETLETVATAEVIEPSATEASQPGATPTGGSLTINTPPPATSLQVPTATPSGAIGANVPPGQMPSGIEPPAEPAAIQLNFAGQTYQPAGVNFCEVQANGERVCLDRPLEAQGAVIQLLQNYAIQVQVVEGARPEQVDFTFLNLQTMEEAQTTTRDGDYLMLFNIDAPVGSYFLRVTIRWGNTTASYFFRVQVS